MSGIIESQRLKHRLSKRDREWCTGRRHLSSQRNQLNIRMCYFEEPSSPRYCTQCILAQPRISGSWDELYCRQDRWHPRGRIPRCRRCIRTRITRMRWSYSNITNTEGLRSNTGSTPGWEGECSSLAHTGKFR